MVFFFLLSNYSFFFDQHKQTNKKIRENKGNGLNGWVMHKTIELNLYYCILRSNGSDSNK